LGFPSLKVVYMTATTEVLVQKLTQGEVSFKFRKVDGSIREAKGTLNSDLIPVDQRTSAEIKADAQTIAYFDLTAQGWRSFRSDSIVA